MQTMVVTVIVLGCLAALVRGIWKQFSGRGVAGCGGCAGAKGCSQQKNGCATSQPLRPAEAPVQWRRLESSPERRLN